MALMDILQCLWYILQTMVAVGVAGWLFCMTASLAMDAWDWLSHRKERK